jgi:Concanavalin A-like lectin/glucanases superfamily
MTMGLATGCSAVVDGQVGGYPAHTGARPRLGTADATCPAASAVPPKSIKDAYDRQVLSDAPVMYLTMAQPSLGTEADLSGNRHTGTYLPVGTHPKSVKLPNGDQAAQFNGSGQYLQVPSANSLSVTDTGCLTIQAWARPSTLQFPHEQGSGYVYILGKGAAGKQEYALRMYSLVNTEVPVRPNRVSAYVFNVSGGKGSGSYFQNKIQVNAWMMITFVIDDHPSASWPDGYVAIYKNDQLRGQVSIGQFNVRPHASAAPFCVATRQLESYFQGAVGKVAVFDYVLSGQQIAAIYNAMS